MEDNRPGLQATDLKKVMRRYLDRLREHREALNRLNVYPVPDGDTGTNMTLTVESVVAECEPAESMAELAHAIAHGSLMGAQGNSGIILSQILRGLADVFRDAPAVGARQLVEALDRASAAAYAAVGKPVEGTILTVLREAAAAAQETETAQPEELGDLLRRVYLRGEQALEETPDLLPVLKEAGVVDAGAAGFLLLLAALLEEVSGEAVVLPEEVFRAAAARLLSTAPEPGDRGIADLRYEVMFLLDGEEGAAERLKEAWASIGESIVVVGGGGTWNCHIHTDDIGPALEAGIAVGRPHRIQVTDLLDQAAAEGYHGEPAFEPLPAFASAPVGVVAVGAGDGVVRLFREAGAQGVVRGGQTMNPSVRDLLDVVEDVHADTVIVLPNNKNIIPVAEQMDGLSGKRVLVVPTRSVAEGLAAMLAYMPSDDGTRLAEAMEKAAAAVTTGEITRAVRDAPTAIGRVREGDWLGLVDGDVRTAHDQPEAVLFDLLETLVDGEAELVTVITGDGADRALVDRVRDWMEERHPGVGLDVIEGGQPLYPYLLGVE